MSDTKTAVRNWDGYDHVGQIMAYEQGDLDDDQAIRLIQYLVDTGLAWSLQGSYGRMAQRMIQVGLVAPRPNLAPLYGSVEEYVEDNEFQRG